MLSPPDPSESHASDTPTETPGPHVLPRIFSGLRTVISSTILSRLLGMVRDIATASLFGLGPVMDAFAFAFRIPNLARRLFGEGALSAAFLPVFAREFEKSNAEGSQSAWQLASAVFSLLSAVLAILVVVGELGLALFAANSADSSSRLLIGLTAVMLPYAVLICLAAQVTAVLHALGEFTIPALLPVVLNLCLLATIWLVDPLFDPDRVAQAYALAVCVLIAGVLQLALQLPGLHRLGFRFSFQWKPVWPAVTQILRSMLPVTLGLSITQINTMLDSCIAWAFSRAVDGPAQMSIFGHPNYPLEAGAVSALYYGERIYQFPVGVFGVALGTVLFPLFSRHAARGEFDRLRDDLTLALRLVLVIGLPASAGLMLVAEPFMRLLFQHGDFHAADASRTASVIIAYGAGVWAYCGIPVLYRGFYAAGHNTAPVRIGLIAVASDLVLNLTLIWPLAERGLAYSTALSAGLQVVVLSLTIQKYVGRLDWGQLLSTATRTLFATASMSVVCLVSLQFCPTGESMTAKAAGLLVPLCLGVVTYFAAAYLLRIEELWLLFRRDRPLETGEREM